ALLKVGEKYYRGVEDVDLTNGGDENVTISLEPPIDLQGSIVVEGPGAQKYRNLQVKLWLREGLEWSHFLPLPPTATVKGALSFTLPNVMAGDWHIDVSPIPSGGYLKAIYLGNEEVRDTWAEIGPETKGPVKIVLSTRAAKIEGDVENLKEGARAMVVLVPTA